MKVYIKNMVSESCIVIVKQALEELSILPLNIKLGEIETAVHLDHEDKRKLSSKISKVGLEIIESKDAIIVEKVKTAIIEFVYHSDEKPLVTPSAYISEKLGLSYGYLANTFSKIESKTIEQYLAALKVERVKELIVFDEDTLSQIAFKLHYSSVAHLSKQFKKVTGITPSHFKTLKNKERRSIRAL